MTLRLTFAARLLLVAMLGVGGMAVSMPAQAQQLVVSVNGYPITSYDVAQRMKLLRVLHQPATREAAIESMIDDRIKLQEMSKYSIQASDQDILGQGARDANAAKISPAALGQALQAAHIDPQHWKDHFKAQYVWNVYVAALNKTVEISENDIRAELRRQGKSTAVTEYVLRQVIVVVPGNAAPGAVEGRMREAEGLRTRFTSCDGGAALARQMSEVAVKEQIVKTSASLPDKLRQVIDRTPIGHLTPPERSPLGIEMLAVCQKKNVVDDSSATADIKNELLYKRLRGESQRLFRKFRERAVITRG